MALCVQVVLPVALSFCPTLVVVASGFDAAIGDPLGDFAVSPWMFGAMAHMLRALANGRLVLALEGGYNYSAISASAECVLRSLLHQPPPSRLRGTALCVIAGGRCNSHRSTCRAECVDRARVCEHVAAAATPVDCTGDPLAAPQHPPTRASRHATFRATTRMIPLPLLCLAQSLPSRSLLASSGNQYTANAFVVDERVLHS